MTPVKIGIDTGMLSVPFDIALMQPLQYAGATLATALVVIPKPGEWAWPGWRVTGV